MSVELVMCDLNFPVRGCSICARKRDKLYIGKCMTLTISLSGLFSLCTFGSLGGRGKSFNVDLVLLGMFFQQDLSVL